MSDDIFYNTNQNDDGPFYNTDSEDPFYNSGGDEPLDHNGTSDSQFQAMVAIARSTSIQEFAAMASTNDEECPYNTDDTRTHMEEDVVHQGFEELGAAPARPAALPSWICHQTNVDALQQRLNQSMGNHRHGLSNLAGQAYHLEKLDHKHRMGDVLQQLYPEWQQSPAVARGMSFFEWLDSLSYFEVYAKLKQLKNESYARANAPAFMKGVAYLDRLTRRHYVVVPSTRKQMLLWNERPLSTAHLETVFSGKGWGAWVLSSTDRFYTGPHVRGEFHHSSFLSGKHVKAAGEWKVEKGRLKFITGKTGHYRCGIQQLVEALQLIQSKIGLGGANVVVWDPHKQKPVQFPAMVFVSNPVIQEEYAAIGRDPLHTPQRAQPRMQIGGHRRPNS